MAAQVCGGCDDRRQNDSLGNEPLTVVGVLSPNFAIEPPMDLWLPLQAETATTSLSHYIWAAARLRPGVSIEQARARLKIASEEFLRRFPLFTRGTVLDLQPLQESLAGDVRKPLLILLGSVLLVLLIACANAANLMLARGIARREEIAIRVSLGAGGMRIASQFVAESAVLTTAATLVGIGGAQLFLRVLEARNVTGVPRMGVLTLDSTAILFSVAAAAITALLFGLLPALRLSDLSASIGSSQRSGASRGDMRLKSMLAVSEIVLALVLLAGATLMIRTFQALHRVRPGFDAHNILTAEMSLAGAGFERTSAVDNMVRDAQRRMESLPGVEAAASTWTLPVELAFGSTFIIEGRPLPEGPVHGGVLMRPVSAGFFEVFRIPILRGRAFTDRDTANRPGVAIISQALAVKYWPGGNPIGERLTIDKYLGPEFAAPPREIIGVAGDVKDYGLAEKIEPMIYLPQSQVTDGMTATDTRILPLTWAVRTAGDPYALREPIREALRQSSKGLPISRIRSMEEVVAGSTARSDFSTALFGGFAAMALLLAAIGVYGLIAYTVEQRTREIGVRLAVGATPRDIRSMVVRQTAWLTFLGILGGTAASMWLARFMSSLLYEVETTDPLSFVAAAAILAVAAMMASYVPAIRAAKIDPLDALRQV